MATFDRHRGKCQEDCVQAEYNQSNIRRVKNLCDTCWIERHYAIHTMWHLLVPVVQALEEIRWPNENVCFTASAGMKALSPAATSENCINLSLRITSSPSTNGTKTDSRQYCSGVDAVILARCFWRPTCQSFNPEASRNAKALLNSMDAEFLVSLVVLETTLTLTKAVAEALQKTIWVRNPWSLMFLSSYRAGVMSRRRHLAGFGKRSARLLRRLTLISLLCGSIAHH